MWPGAALQQATTHRKGRTPDQPVPSSPTSSPDPMTLFICTSAKKLFNINVYL